MIDFTQKILSLDEETVLELSNANAISIATKRKADLAAKQRFEEVQQTFLKQKNSESVELAKAVKEEKKKVLENLQQKMKSFDEEIQIDILLEDLLSIARDRICR